MKALSPSELEGFYQKGYVKIEEGFSPDFARDWSERCWHRLGIDPNDRSTWKENRIHMGGSEYVQVADVAPRVWDAMQDLLGGAERIADPVHWSDHFIVNLGVGADEPWAPAGPECPGWHKDGDFFRHFLDSPEQGLLVFVLWTDVVHHGGPTYIATDSVKVLAEFLAARPEGVLPNEFGFQNLIKQCSQFEEATGKAGDVYLLHPFVLHAVSQNILRVPRIITNPPVALKEPMRLLREDGAYSPVERSILNALGVDRLDFRIAHGRERIVPDRVRRQIEMMEEEKRRLATETSGT